MLTENEVVIAAYAVSAVIGLGIYGAGILAYTCVPKVVNKSKEVSETVKFKKDQFATKLKYGKDVIYCKAELV